MASTPGLLVGQRAQQLLDPRADLVGAPDVDRREGTERTAVAGVLGQPGPERPGVGRVVDQDVVAVRRVPAGDEPVEEPGPLRRVLPEVIRVHEVVLGRLGHVLVDVGRAVLADRAFAG